MAAAHLDDDHRFSLLGKLPDYVELGACPGDGAAIHALFFNTVVDAADVDDYVTCTCSGPDGEPVASCRVTLATRSLGVVDGDIELLCGPEWAVKISRYTGVIT